METGGLSVTVIVILIVAAPVILILVGYGLVFFWRKKSQEVVIGLGERIQRGDDRLGGMHHFLEEYSGTNQEPYSSHLSALKTEIGELQSQLEAFLETTRGFDNEVRGAQTKALLDIINMPVRWFQRWRRSVQLQNECTTLEVKLSTTDQHIEQINELPWEVAQDCRRVDKDLNEINDTALALQNSGVRGETLQKVIQEVQPLQKAMDGIPTIFFDGDKEAVLAVASEEDTIRAFTVLKRAHPATERCLPLVREWDTHFKKATGEYNELKLAGATLRQAITNPPPGLVITALQVRLDQISQMAGDINKRLNQPEADTLKTLSREVVQLRRVIQDTERQLDRTRQQAGELSMSIDELRGGLDNLANQMAILEHSTPFPLAWDRSSSLLQDLRKRLQALGPAQQPRTPEQVAQHLKEAGNIRAGYQALNEQYPQVTQQYRALAALLESEEIEGGSAWLNKTREILAHTAQYDPRNWPKQDALSTLPNNVEELANLQGQMLPADPSTQIKETDLEQRLAETQRLSALHKTLRPHMERVSQRLEKVLGMEKEGKDLLTEASNAMHLVARLTGTNELLFDVVGKDFDRLGDELEQANNELSNPAQGEMEKKLQKISTLSEKVNRALNGWLVQLNTAITEQGKTISDQLIQLDSAGNLDEPHVIEARNLLNRDEYLSALRAPGVSGSTAGRLRDAVLPRQTMLNNLDATAEIKRKSDFWLVMVATHKAMEERTGTLLTAYQETIQARSEAREQIKETARRAPKKPAWPPNSQSALDEQTAIGPVDQRWEALKTGVPRRIDAAILELGRLTQQYRLASEQAAQVIHRIEQDEERISDLEESINQLKERWQVHAQADPNNQVIQEGVRQLMSRADERLSFIRQQYMRGQITYEMTLQNMRLLNDELFAARVPIDEKNDIGLNETPRRIGAD